MIFAPAAQDGALFRWAKFSFACQKRTRKAPATFEAREARIKGYSPLIIPKEMGSIQKIQVAALEDFLCCADFKSLTRRTVWQGCVFFLAKTVICKLFMNICDFSAKRIEFELYLLIAELINALVAYLNAPESAVFKHLALCKAEHTF